MKKSIVIFSIVLLLLSSLGLNVYANSYPKISTIVSDSNYDYFIYTLPNSETYVRVTTMDTDKTNEYITPRFFVTSESRGEQGNKIAIDPNSAIVVNQYALRNGSWVLISTTNLDGSYTKSFEKVVDTTGSMTIHESTLDIEKEGSSENFFPQTLPLAVVMERIMTKVQVVEVEAVGTMKILAVCGVGCLALLTGLILFGKVFRRLGVQ